MRITFVNRLAGILWGGGESFDLQAARALRQLGHEINFVIGRRWSTLDLPLVEFPTTYVRTPYLRWLMYRFESQPNKILRFLGYRAMDIDLYVFERAALRIIKKTNLAARTDVFQISGMAGLGAQISRKLNKLSVLVWHGPPKPRVWRKNQYCSATFTFGDTLTAVRQSVAPDAVEITPGVDTELFQRIPFSRIRPRYQIPEEGIVFIFVGRLIPVKNLLFLIDTFSQLIPDNPNLYLLLVGDGPQREDLEKKVNALNLQKHIHFAGRQSGEDLVAHYNSADVFVITSTYESFSLVVLEAMSCELPVIATRVGWLPNLVDEGKTGWLVESGSVQDLKAALLSASQDPSLLHRIGRCNRERVIRQYSWLQTAKKMEQLYASL